jgi:predicted extracellular nuclease
MRRISVVFAVVALLVAGIASAGFSPVVISQVYGGGGNSGATYKNDFVELFNRGPAAASLAGMSIQYTSATGTGLLGASSTLITELPSVTLQPGQYFLIQEAQGSGGTVDLPTPDYVDATPINMSGTGGKVALVNSATGLGCNGGSTPCSGGQLALILDLVGWDGANFYETAAGPATSNTTALLRAGGGCTDVDNNSTDFMAAAPSPRNTASLLNSCGGPTNPTGTGGASPASVPAGDATLLTVAVTPGASPVSTGLTVTADLTLIGGSTAQTFFDDGTNGDVTADDNVFSFQTTVAGGTSAGPKVLPVTITDDQSRTGSATIVLTVEPPVVAIHDIQGSGGTSLFAGQLVATTGIVTGIKYNGFFIQTPDEDVDSDPNTSEGIFVFTSIAPPLTADIGNSVKVTGTVQEYVPSADPYSPPMTEIGTSPTVSVLSSGNVLPAPVTITAADTLPDGGLDQLEKFEGMRVHVESLTVVAPTGGTLNETTATANSNGVFYGVLPGIDRPFTEPGIQAPNPIPTPPCCIPQFDGNPEKLRVDSDGLVGDTAIEVTAGAAVTDITGPLDYAYRTYTILPDPGTLSQDNVSGNISAASVPDPCPAELTVATSNMGRLFDASKDDTEPVLTPGAFANRLAKISLAIRDVMKVPDIVGVEEVEHLSTLQALADKVNADAVAGGDPDPQYVAYVEEGNDVGGIDVGFLVKTPKVTVVDVTQIGKDATYINPLTSLPETLNDRPPLVLRAEVQPPAGTALPVTVIVNHLRSLNGIDDPSDGPRVRAKRAAQAEFLANLIQEHQDAGEQVISLGDYNATQFNDGYVDVLGTVIGSPAPADEVLLPTAALVSPNLADLLDLAPADERYSYVFDGNAEELDHILVTANLLPRVNGLYYARDNADFPTSYLNDPARPERFSDHDIPVAYIQIPAVFSAVSATPAVLWPANHKMVPVTVNYDLQNVCTADPVSVSLAVSSNEPVNGLGDGDTAPDWSVVDAHHVKLRAERSGIGKGRVYTITITATDSRGNASTQTATVKVPHNN